MGIFRYKKKTYPDFSMLGTDLHNHVLPGMDDGSATMEESLKILREMAKTGFRKIIATPHVISSIYPNTKDQILGQMYHLQDIIKQEGINIEVEASGEYHMDQELLAKVQEDEVIPFGRNKYLLIELPFQKPSFSCEKILLQIQMLGYQPVIAHPERYVWLMGNMKQYEKLKDQGFLFQLNINSLNGLYGFPARITARRLIDAAMIAFTGSDVHHSGQVAELKKVLSDKHFERLVNSGNLLNGEI